MSEELIIDTNIRNNKFFQKQGGDARLFGLDIFRILLTVEIVMFHSNGQLGCSYGKVINLFLRAGAVTMTAFFILSGYVNQHAISNRDFSKKSVIKRFYFDRVISILPTYYFVAFLFSILLAVDSVWDQIILIPIETLCLQTIFTSLFTVSHNGGTWFISCIMICYLVFPLITLLIGKMSSRTKLIGIWGLTA